MTNLGDYAFGYCSNLVSVYFWGNAPRADATVFANDTNATVYYLTATSGWSNTFAGIPVAPIPFTFMTNAGTITITGYTGPGGTVVIPATICGYAVTSLAADAFENHASLTNVTIPSTVTSLGDGAFLGCTNLASAYFGGNAPAAGSSVLGSTTARRRIICLGARAGAHLLRVFRRGWKAPARLNSLTQPTPARSQSQVTWFKQVVLHSRHHLRPAGNRIGTNACQGNSKLWSLTIPGTVQSISQGAFQSCFNLDEVTIGDGVSSIGVDAFWSCSFLISVTIGDSVTNIGAGAFEGCPYMTSVTIPGSVASIGASASRPAPASPTSRSPMG